MESIKKLQRKRKLGVFLVLLTAMIILIPALCPASEFVVYNLNDSGPGSLRQAIIDLNAGGAADSNTIRFDVGGNITALVTPFGLISKPVTFANNSGADVNIIYNSAAIGPITGEGAFASGSAPIAYSGSNKVNVQVTGPAVTGFYGNPGDGGLNLKDLSGTINITGTAAGANTYGFAMHVFGPIKIETLSGTLNVASPRKAWAIYSYPDYWMGFNNPGDLTIGTLSGNVNATATTYQAYAVWGREHTYIGLLSGNVTATAGSYSAFGLNGDGMNISAVVDTLSGNVTATAGSYKAGAVDFTGGTLTFGTITPTGRLTATAGTNRAWGIAAWGGTVTIGTMAGTIEATAGTHTAFGIYASNGITIGRLSGSVTASANGPAAAIISGGPMNIYVTGALTGIDRSGTGEGYAIRAASYDSGTFIYTRSTADNIVTLDTGAAITGKIDLGDGANTLNLLGTNSLNTSVVGVSDLNVGDGINHANWTLESLNNIGISRTAIIRPLSILYNKGTLTNSGTLYNAGTFNNDGTLTNSGTINNTGTFELAAGSTFNCTGGTFNNNSGGTLVVRQNIGFGDPVVGTINLNNGGTVENFATIVHFAGHTQDNAGTFNNNAGAVFVNQGTINNTGTLDNKAGATVLNTGNFTNTAASTVINNGVIDSTGGTFINNGLTKGSGTFTNVLINNGTIAPGNSIGTMTVTGNYTSNPGSLYELEFNTANQSDRIAVTGTATLNGGTVLLKPEPGIFVKGVPYTYTILTAGLVNGGFTGVSGSIFFNTSLMNTATKVDLTLSRMPFDVVAETENQTAIARATDSIYESGQMTGVTDTILGFDASGARNAFNQMAGLVHTAVPAVTFSVFNQYMDVMKARMAGFISGGPSSMLAAKPIMLSSRTDTGNDASNTLLAAAASSPAVPGIHSKAAWGFWVQGYGSLGERKASDISSKYDYDTAGIVVGFDRKINPSFLLGATLGYSHTKLDMKDLDEDAKLNSYQASLYGIYKQGLFYLNAIAAYGYNKYDTDRTISFATINRATSADYSGHVVSGYLEGGYKLITKYVDVIPLASFQVAYLSRNSFSEDGAADLGIDARSESFTSYIGALGVKLRREYAVAQGTLTPELRLRWDHEFSNNDNTLRAAFLGSPATTFSVSGDRPDRDRIAAGLGLNWQIKDNVSLNLSYDGYFSNDTTQHAGIVGFRYQW
jgi:outer membrane autotransporter protein